MKTVETNFRFSGDGFGHAPRQFRLMRREGRVCLYERLKPSKSIAKDPDILPRMALEGYEVVIVTCALDRVVFGKNVEAHEIYPSSKDFPARGSFVLDLDRAEKLFEKWVKEEKAI